MLQRQQKSKRTDTLFPYTTLSRSGRWPTCQNMNLADGAEDTWSVTYVKGYAVPKGGQVAAGMLAVELAKAACNDKRSEEHTSELQSLMRISYAVFCLKNTTQPTAHGSHHYATRQHNT